jgi:hypothetical protein
MVEAYQISHFTRQALQVGLKKTAHCGIPKCSRLQSGHFKPRRVSDNCCTREVNFLPDGTRSDGSALASWTVVAGARLFRVCGGRTLFRKAAFVIFGGPSGLSSTVSFLRTAGSVINTHDTTSNELSRIASAAAPSELLRLAQQLLHPPTNTNPEPTNLNAPLDRLHNLPAPCPPPHPQRNLRPTSRSPPSPPPLLPLPIHRHDSPCLPLSLGESGACVFGDRDEYFDAGVFGLCDWGEEDWTAATGFVEAGGVGEGGGCSGGEDECADEDAGNDHRVTAFGLHFCILGFLSWDFRDFYGILEGRFARVTFITFAGMEGGVPIGTFEQGFLGGRAATDEFDNHGFSVPATEICFAKYLYLHS